MTARAIVAKKTKGFWDDIFVSDGSAPPDTPKEKTTSGGNVLNAPLVGKDTAMTLGNGQPFKGDSVLPDMFTTYKTNQAPKPQTSGIQKILSSKLDSSPNIQTPNKTETGIKPLTYDDTKQRPYLKDIDPNNPGQWLANTINQPKEGNFVKDQNRSRQIDPVTGTILKYLMAPANAAVYGVNEGVDQEIRGFKEAPNHLGAAIQDVTAAPVKTALSLANLLSPVMAGFTEANQGLEDVGLGEVNNAIMSPATSIAKLLAPKGYKDIAGDPSKGIEGNPDYMGTARGLETLDQLAQLAMFHYGTKGVNYLKGKMTNNPPAEIPFPPDNRPPTEPPVGNAPIPDKPIVPKTSNESPLSADPKGQFIVNLLKKEFQRVKDNKQPFNDKLIAENIDKITDPKQKSELEKLYTDVLDHNKRVKKPNTISDILNSKENKNGQEKIEADRQGAPISEKTGDQKPDSKVENSQKADVNIDKEKISPVQERLNRLLKKDQTEPITPEIKPEVAIPDVNLPKEDIVRRPRE